MEKAKCGRFSIARGGSEKRPKPKWDEENVEENEHLNDDDDEKIETNVQARKVDDVGDASDSTWQLDYGQVKNIKSPSSNTMNGKMH